jgi:hypothetical protein
VPKLHAISLVSTHPAPERREIMRLRILLTTLALVATAVANGGYGWGP